MNIESRVFVFGHAVPINYDVTRSPGGGVCTRFRELAACAIIRDHNFTAN